jgi:hypothetical protein
MSKGIAPGVLVMMIKSTCGNEGKIGTAIRHVGNVDYIENGVLDSWEVEFPTPIRTCGGKSYSSPTIPTSWLRPVSGLKVNDEELIKELIMET